LDELHCIVPADCDYRTALADEADAIAFVGDMKHLGSKGGADELSVRVSFARYLLKHIGNCCSILSVEIGVYLIEEIKGCWVASLNSEHESQSAQA
jgi:hypothetical protein